MIDYAEHFMPIPIEENEESQYTGNDLVFRIFIQQIVQEQPGDRDE